MSFCPGFCEPLACGNMGDWPHGFCRSDFIINPNLDFNNFQQESLNSIKNFSQYYGVEESVWEDIILKSKTVEEIRSKIENKFKDYEFIFYRWNQCLFYFYEWISKGDDFLWISMIRDPLDRACSSWKKHRWEIKDSLENTMYFASKVEILSSHKNFYFVYYEDLVDNPEKTIREIYSFLGKDISNVNLTEIKGSNGKDFIPQSSDIKDVHKKKDGYLTNAEKFSCLYKNKIGRNKNEEYIDNITRESFKRFLSGFQQYERYFKE